ncbi:hypothetical protein RND81_10G251500 [Saponaria officinalis]|uniref:Uncharacterized protein n=1 Tax=Saponaria officinalis TaxID=3572 RepID=A0AAW1I884_SAPOF
MIWEVSIKMIYPRLSSYQRETSIEYVIKNYSIEDMEALNRRRKMKSTSSASTSSTSPSATLVVVPAVATTAVSTSTAAAAVATVPATIVGASTSSVVSTTAGPTSSSNPHFAAAVLAAASGSGLGKKTSFKAAAVRATAKHAIVQSTEALPEFPQVQFASSSQRTKFSKLADSDVSPTRFLCQTSLVELGLFEHVAELLNGTGMSGLITLDELTYRQLTLEFFQFFCL